MKDSRFVSSIHLNLEAAAFVFLISYAAAPQNGKIVNVKSSSSLA